jgi:hypothetical protein
MKAFPKEIFVAIEEDGKDTYLTAVESQDEVSIDGASRPVARYQLVEAGEIVVSREFQKKRPGRK